ncbi:AAA family ATPase [Selenomonas sp.]|jgi:pilus assembly protein CpaE|uniref:AAA family ATPase n=1 Tax=Selenomonas sp. TaxID=2053611 RepID=UPI003A0FF35F
MQETTGAVSGAVITFFSTASAVGKTLLSCNMASELARQGARVALVDFDLQFGDICNYLHLEPQQTVADAERSVELMGDAFDVRECLATYRYSGVEFSVLAAPKALSEAYNLRTPILRQLIERLRVLYDYVILDTTSMFSELNVAMLDLSTIVTFLGVVDFIPTIKNMKIGSETLKTLGYQEKIRLVLNRSNAKTHISLDDVESILGQPFYHILPNDFQAASQSIRDGVPLVLKSRHTDLSEALRDLVARYTNRPQDVAFDEEAGPEKTSWFDKIFH